jgi:Cft2 family RNA processing exonuclease
MLCTRAQHPLLCCCTLLADHYGGLTKEFRRGVIYCTPVTAALAALKLKVPLHVLRPLPLGQTEVVEGESRGWR